MHTEDINDEWQKFLQGEEAFSDEDDEQPLVPARLPCGNEQPECTPIYISTKTKIAFLNKEIDLLDVFWKIPVMDYDDPKNGVIKKQIKLTSETAEELDRIHAKMAENENYVEEYVIQHIDNPIGRIKFKDVRKISIGLCKKDIMSYRCKKKSAFYNCFVMILRILHEDLFREIHVKVFNTGKMEIPGIQSDTLFHLVKEEILRTMAPILGEETTEFKEARDETVLINSNFNCGYFIDREKLYEVLKYKYHIDAIFDPCSYPGIQCKFYFNTLLPEGDLLQNGSTNHCKLVDSETEKIAGTKKVIKLPKHICEVSFMIFRTGSVLIVGKCEDSTLFEIYDFIKKLLKNEYPYVSQEVNGEEYVPREKKKKNRKKWIYFNVDVPVPPVLVA